MIHIVSGPIDSGKTSRMRALYDACPPGAAAGFISPKLYHGERFSGYELYSLADGQSAVLALLETDYDDRYERSFRFHQFIFSDAAFELGTSIIDRLLQENFNGEIFIDEIGPIELQGGGFAPILRQALRAGVDLTICVREACLEEVLSEFDIKDYLLICAPK